MLIEYIKNAPGARVGDVKEVADHFANILILSGHAKRYTGDEPSAVNGDLLSQLDADAPSTTVEQGEQGAENEELATLEAPAKPKRTKKTTKTDTDTE